VSEISSHTKVSAGEKSDSCQQQYEITSPFNFESYIRERYKNRIYLCKWYYDQVFLCINYLKTLNVHFVLTQSDKIILSFYSKYVRCFFS